VSHLELLESEFYTFQIELPRVQKLALATYCDELVRWNSKINLTSLSGAALVRRLVAEPVWIARELHVEGSLVDIGSGNGSPAIPFHIVSPFLTCDLIEARAKRAAFLRHLAVMLKSSGITVHRARFEEVASSLKSPTWISLQAVTLTKEIIDSIRSIASPTTTIIWITSQGTRPVLNPIRMLTIPITRTQVFLFNLDLS
jgi:16S rRNA (guanine(527)-N(7))-methyltransferase RsmG